MIINEKLGRLTITEESGRTKDGKKRFLCRCECGKDAHTTEYKLTSKHTNSCGCLRRDLMRHKSTKHGLSENKVYRVRATMVQRCHNPDNSDFCYCGERGVVVCQRRRQGIGRFDHRQDRQ